MCFSLPGTSGTVVTRLLHRLYSNCISHFFDASLIYHWVWVQLWWQHCVIFPPFFFLSLSPFFSPYTVKDRRVVFTVSFCDLSVASFVFTLLFLRHLYSHCCFICLYAVDADSFHFPHSSFLYHWVWTQLQWQHYGLLFFPVSYTHLTLPTRRTV